MTVAVDDPRAAQLACGVNFSCPGGPAGSFCVDNTGLCFAGTVNCFNNSCLLSGCFPNSGGCGLNYSTLATRTPEQVKTVLNIQDRATRAEVMATMKADLQQALKDLEAQERIVEAEAAPQTLEEAEALEANLKHALDEVGEVKKKLEK